MKVAALTLTTLALLFITVPLMADSPSNKTGARKTEEKSEFDIKCKDRDYLEMIEQFKTILKDVRQKMAKNAEQIKIAKDQGKDPGPADLPGRPPLTFVAPEDLRMVVFLRKAAALLNEQERFYQGFQTKTLLRFRTMLMGNEQLLKELIEDADENCVQLEAQRARSSSLGDPTPHASALASASPRPSSDHFY